MKILKDNIKMLATKVPSGGQELATELNVVLENYQLLCNRIRGKCHTLEVRLADFKTQVGDMKNGKGC